MTKRIEISRDIVATPQLIYATISDVTRMGEWSEECHDCEWHEGFDHPEVGALSTDTIAMASTSGRRRAKS
jgi:hypothetical protein